MKQINLIVIFLVTWQAMIQHQVGCDNGPPPNPYTGEPPNYSYADYCFEFITKIMRREFPTKEEAEKFIKDAPIVASDFNITEVK